MLSNFERTEIPSTQMTSPVNHSISGNLGSGSHHNFLQTINLVNLELP